MSSSLTILTIDLDAVKANYHILKSTSGDAEVAGIVKSNAYGTGVDRIAPLLHHEGCRTFFVATSDEGAVLRNILHDVDIYVLNGVQKNGIPFFHEHRLSPVLSSLHDIHEWSGGPCAIHFDTGMNRLGLNEIETRAITTTPTILAGKDIRLCMSHFACADEKNHPLNQQQCEEFNILRTLIKNHVPGARWSLCNSSGIFHAPDHCFDMVRPGYALYGGNPTPDTANPMKPVIHVHAPALQTKRAKEGTTVGYGATHQLDHDMDIAVIGIGYADGFFRSGSNRSCVHWNGTPCPVLGRVSMDMITVGIGHIGGLKPKKGDFFEIIGPHQTIDVLAKTAGTIGYEILTSLGQRLTRVYKETS